MLTHIVAWKYREEVTIDQRTQHLQMLQALPAAIPEIIRFSAGFDCLHLERSYDTGLVAVFENREALDAYTNHPEHLEVAALGKAIAAQVVSVDFVD